MSVSFYGKHEDGSSISLDFEHEAFLNLSNGNAAAFCNLLRLPLDCGWGECSVVDARRAIIYARATFDKRAEGFTRDPSDTKRPGKCRVIDGGIDANYLSRRLDGFERFVNTVVEMGATSLYWG